MDNTTYFAQFTDNTYFNAFFLEYKMQDYFDTDHTEDCKKAFENIKILYSKLDIVELSEAQLEDKFIKNVLIEIGYAYTYQITKKVFGKIHKPDFALFESEEIERISGGKDKSSTENILALCESKAYKVNLDNRETTTKNPHFQLLRYQSDLRINYGFLTNGKKWRFYDITNPKQDKIYFEIDLEWIIQNDDYKAFQYFYYNFYKKQILKLYNKERGVATKEKTFAELNQEYILEVEKDLKELIYGKDSIIEMIGQRLFARYGNEYSIKEIYANSLTFGFRLLFVAYFEGQFRNPVFGMEAVDEFHPLRNLLAFVKMDKHLPEKHNGWNMMKHFFDYLNYGNIDLEMPLLNGGLFAEHKAPLLKLPLVLSNKDIEQILTLLLYHKGNELFQAYRDYKTLSVTHLGNIYEGLLESEFRQAFEGTYYLTFLDGKTEKEGYFDSYDYQEKKKNKKITILEERFYKNDELYLSNQSGNRKTTASYYTPQDITHFMAEESIQKLLKENEEKKKSILDLRLMDNACGSGHFLIASLDVLTSEALKRIENRTDKKLEQTIETEKVTILKTLSQFNPIEYHQIDELRILKRILLKKIIFGVDLNEFAIELTRLSLWLDTFILGTPLSFIEHHIKQGNALIGAKKEELYKSLQTDNNLFADSFKNKVAKIIEDLSELSNLKDTTAEEIAQSKAIYKKLEPSLEKLNLAMNFHTYKRFVPFIFESKAEAQKELDLLNATLTDFEDKIFNKKDAALVEQIEKTAEQFSFFNYEITFAEVFQNGHRGFDLIIGNPPWDKTKFSDADFFSMWRSSYRTMKNKEKEATRQNVLGYKGIQNEYNTKKGFVVFANEYYKNYYPHNAGVGDNNLFRFFIEQNLGLLTKDGTLTYITPSAWIYEDSSINIRKHIFENYQLEFFYQFENKKAIFPDVHRSYKFAVFQITQLDKSKEKRKTLPVRFMQTDTEILYKTEIYDGRKGILEYPYEDIYTLSPLHHALFEIKDQKDLDIIRNAYKRFDIINPSFIDFRNELHMTADRDLFKEQPNDMILYEGKMIHQYTNNLATPNYWIKTEEFEAKLIKTEVNRLINNIYEFVPQEKYKSTKKNTVLSFLGLNEEEELKQFVVFNKDFPRLMYRGIARNTDSRTLIAGIIPSNHTFGHSMFGHIAKKYAFKNGKVVIDEIPLERVLFVQSIFNSMVVDFIIRFMVDINVVKSILMRLPIPQPSDKELSENPIYQKLIKNALLLNLSNTTNLEELKEKVNFKIQKSDIPTTQKRKDKLQAENDLLIAELYGLTKEQLQHLTSPAYFKILNDKNKAYLSLLE
ncbi:Eco57I restriction endonuclease [Bernardetia litoralis DSM 6794]|uniref:site-specific DNA-methyltransferase (adenine-specific) n=1 Tax=Bernardetia litoralis (strain ATCC 23117 / DSM 6794 / NBRC 15988 / NCIMB 1366 / Fx l1 / Sio-4) TaxID=880071 RepID=I4AH73_BERLS|nr:DNA methyltransferase [Bernardetia litoralis]AFM03308.1 Eco57I restriction endonuclease [Bernardetia litoralis DSM 6794]